jgi:hypothetical protein
LRRGHSLLDQSLHALFIECPIRQDGFAVGHYDRRPVPELCSHLHAPTDSERVFLFALSAGRISSAADACATRAAVA